MSPVAPPMPVRLVLLGACLALAGLTGPPPCRAAEVQLLDDTTLRGDVQSLTEEALVLKAGPESRRLPLDQILHLTAAPPESAETDPLPESTFTVYLTDQSCLRVRSLLFQGPEAELHLDRGEALRVRLAALQGFHRGAPSEPPPGFPQALERQDLQGDLLLLRREEQAHQLEGAVQSFDGERLQYGWEGELLSVPAARMEAVVFVRSAAQAADPISGQLLDTDGNTWSLARVQGEAQALSFETPTGIQRSCPWDQVRLLDLSPGKIVYLSDLDPVSVQETPFFDITWHYARNQNLRGGPIQLGGRKYARGLALHSRCQLVYQLERRFRRFRAVVGIDDVTRGHGHVLFRIAGDGKALLEEPLKGGEPPREIDLEIRDVNLLTILVDYGPGLDLGDHLSLGEARVIK